MLNSNDNFPTKTKHKLKTKYIYKLNIILLTINNLNIIIIPLF